jgi:predicted nucleic acid-binding protein
MAAARPYQGLVLVDTSVWIDFLQDPEALVRAEMTQLIQGENRVAICGVIMQELLQGLKSPKSVHLLEHRLASLPFFTTRKTTYRLAAAIYRRLRQRGVAVQTADATIAAITVENHVPLFTGNLRHFEPMKSVSKLQLYTIR